MEPCGPLIIQIEIAPFLLPDDIKVHKFRRGKAEEEKKRNPKSARLFNKIYAFLKRLKRAINEDRLVTHAADEEIDFLKPNQDYLCI